MLVPALGQGSSQPGGQRRRRWCGISPDSESTCGQQKIDAEYQSTKRHDMKGIERKVDCENDIYKIIVIVSGSNRNETISC